jgi:hypothetical protein
VLCTQAENIAHAPHLRAIGAVWPAAQRGGGGIGKASRGSFLVIVLVAHFLFFLACHNGHQKLLLPVTQSGCVNGCHA